VDSNEALKREFHQIFLSLKTYIKSEMETGKPLIHLDLKRKSLRVTHLSEKNPSVAYKEFSTPVLTLEKIREQMADCQQCLLCQHRTNLVFGEGKTNASLVFVGEAPGADEDMQGRPFVGRAGQLLTKIISAMGLKRSDVYICNILKCRPPGNRNPKPDEIEACEPFLIKQLQAIKPKIICALGTFAAHTLLKTEVPITAMRGRFHTYQGIKLMPTYHPAYLLRNQEAKKLVWEDVQLIMREL
jgi:DNA polymerase